MFYGFWFLASVCDDYLVPSIKQICSNYHIDHDVIGATIMAAAVASPELFMNFIGTFITKGDIGVGTIVGSAVFNVLAVPACCGLFIHNFLKLDWWPITRDCLMYLVAVLALIGILRDAQVWWYEALGLIIVYFGYMLVMYYNKKIFRCSKRLLRRIGLLAPAPYKEVTEFTHLLGHNNNQSKLSLTKEVYHTFNPVIHTSHIMSYLEQQESEANIASPWSREEQMLIEFIFRWPITFLLWLTVPNCRQRHSWKYVTFLLSIIWLAAISYMMAFVITIIEDNVTNDFETFLQNFDDFLLLRGVPRETCPNETEESPLDEFRELFTVEQLRHGWIILHIFAAVYFFILLAIICNDYFLPTVECICDDLNLSKDVAAATFMATATSMPEFFTNTISTLITHSDMGLGTIIGSLMFNTLGVASLGALAINKPVQLDWWPIARDCFIYGFNTIILIILAWGGEITFTESCVMMGFLLIYYLVTFNNNKFMPAIRVFVEDKLGCCFSTRYDLTEPPENSAKAKLPMKKDPLTGNGLFVINLPENTSSMSSRVNLTHSKSWDGDDQSVQLPPNLYTLPRDESKLMKFWWFFTFPLKFILSIIIPNPLKHRKLYPLSFIMCIIAIGCNAYMIVWMLTSFGVAINVPTIIMGLTFLAAGSTMPEAVSSVISLRNGESGIGVSNSLGANSLAILLSLGVPWFIKNCMTYGSTDGTNRIKIAAQGIEYSILILMLCTVTLFIGLSLSGYRLTKRVGGLLFSVYVVFIVLQILIEMNIFFPKQCS